MKVQIFDPEFWSCTSTEKCHSTTNTSLKVSSMVGTVRKLERRHPYLLSSIVTAWYYPCVHFEVTIDTHCSQTVRLSHCSVNPLLRNSGKDGTAAAGKIPQWPPLCWWKGSCFNDCHERSHVRLSYYPTNCHEDWWISHGYFQGPRKHRSC